MLKFFTPWLKRALSSAVATSMLAVSIPFTAVNALAAPSCANADAANRGLDPECSARVVGNQIITYPRTTWALLGVVDIPVKGAAGNTVALTGSELAALGNTPAKILELDSNQVISMVNQVPTNVPYVFGRFNPLSGTLRVDLMKVEETMTPAGKKLGLYHSVFTPKHGDYWKAARMYISPDQFETGTVPGKNPFEPFRKGDDDIFQNVTQEASQVIIGHAMRFTGAPTGLLQVAIPRVAVTQKKSGGFLRKKITTTWTGYLKPSWWLAYPNSILSRDNSRSTMRYCIGNVVTEGKVECPAYEMATTGVAFEEFKGGMLDDTEENWVLRQQTKSGFTLWAIILGVVLLTGAGFFLMSALAPELFAATAGILNTGFAAIGLGGLGTFSAGVGLATLQMTLGTVGVMLFGRANAGGIYKLDARLVMFGTVTSVNTSAPKDQDQDYKKLSSEYAEPRTVSDFVRGGLTLNSFKKTVTGNCGMNSSIQDCDVTDGMSPRTDGKQTTSGASVASRDVISGGVTREAPPGAKFEGGTRYR